MFNGQPPGEAKSSVCGRTWGPGAMAYRCSDWYHQHLGVVHRRTAALLWHSTQRVRVRCSLCALQSDEHEQLHLRGLLQARRRSFLSLALD
jgi:hypothetical protein